MMNWKISTIYLIVIGLEIFISNFRHKKVYTWRESAVTLFLSLFNGLLDLAVRGFYLIVFTFVYQFRLIEITSEFWYWAVLFLLVDLQFYWLHRLEHFCRIFWAAHVTHHSAEHMNISVGFRASLMRPLYDFVFFLPLPVLGFRPIEILLMYSIAQIWAVFVHTEMIGKLGWLEYIFVTPSHHRVHHASNQKYLDKNMGMALIIWDRLFGTFQKELSPEEYEPIRYGLTKPMKDTGLYNVIFHEWICIWKDVKRKNVSWRDRLMYIFGPPGWESEKSKVKS
jgi:sterol desaturase/sphingolipid hydroxylase (fatty acid hydroxylase superfamily)